MKIAVVGGSIGGLGAGLVMQCHDQEVMIYEKSDQTLRERGSGISVQNKLVDYLSSHGISTREALAVHMEYVSYLNSEGKIAMRAPGSNIATSWGHVYRQLYDAFPDTAYDFGRRVAKIEQEDNRVSLSFTDGKTEQCDLLIAADGYQSTIRKQLLPELKPDYTGYIAWRGIMDRKDIPDHIAAIFRNSFTMFFPQDHGYFLGFFVPGKDGSIAEADQRLTWAWIRNADQQRHHELTQDINGKQLEFSMYEGGLRMEEKTRLLLDAERLLPAKLLELINITPNPYFQSIVDLQCPKTVFDRVLLMGDAACVVRPQTGSGALKAFEDAVSLGMALDYHQWKLETALPHWEAQQLSYASELARYGKAAAERSKLGWQFH